ncbi:hypothetical protein ANO11243_071980 [Dothideomycetidae sp. 11243]|nr:hypothetical protein ANO11243_071980 [fungal sp. No.11243]
MADDMKNELSSFARHFQYRLGSARPKDRQAVLRFKRFAMVAFALICIYWLFTFRVTINVAHHHHQASKDVYTRLGLKQSPQLDTPQVTSESHITNYEPDIYLDDIPRAIWQLALGPRGDEGAKRYVNQSRTWRELEDFQYQAMTDDIAAAFVLKNYVREPSIVRFWREVTAMVVRADFLRYLILYAHGGFYSDMDTTCLESPEDWVPEHYNRKHVNVIMGLERDDQDADKPREFLSPVSFTQWTLAAKPGHPIFKSAIRRLMSNIEYLTRMKNKEISEMTGSEFYDKQILAATGPGLMSDILVQHLRDHGHDVNFTSFYNIRQPTLFHDVLILPVHGFGANAHVPLVDGQSFVVHHFAGTWKEENNRVVVVKETTDAKEEKKEEKKEEEKKD